MTRNINALLRVVVNSLEPLTSMELGAQVQISSRTVKREMKDVALVLEAHGARLVADNSGYFVTVIDHQIFSAWQERFQNGRGLSESDVQIEQIVCTLLTQDYVTQDELAEKLYVSRSTIGKLMRTVRNLLDESKIVLSSRPHYGYYLIGKESNIRNFMVRQLLEEEDLEVYSDSILLDRCRNSPEFLRVATRQLVEGGP